MGAIDLMGCTTKITEYNMLPTMNTRINVTTTTTNPQIRISISSAVRSFCWSLNLFLQYRCYKIIRASLRELTSGSLTLSLVEVVRVLAWIPVPVIASSERHKDDSDNNAERGVKNQVSHLMVLTSLSAIGLASSSGSLGNRSSTQIKPEM